MDSATLERARAAKQKAKQILECCSAVNGIGITSAESGYAVKVNLNRPLSGDEAIPESIDGIPVKVELVGAIRKLPA